MRHLAAAAIVTALAAPAAAQTYAVGGLFTVEWDAASRVCIADGPRLDVDGGAHGLAAGARHVGAWVYDPNWEGLPARDVEIAFQFSDGTTSAGTGALDGGVLVYAPADTVGFAEAWARAYDVTIVTTKGVEIPIALDGTARAFAALARCWRDHFGASSDPF